LGPFFFGQAETVLLVLPGSNDVYLAHKFLLEEKLGLDKH
jgi:hypothetical protein